MKYVTGSRALSFFSLNNQIGERGGGKGLEGNAKKMGGKAESGNPYA